MIADTDELIAGVKIAAQNPVLDRASANLRQFLARDYALTEQRAAGVDRPGKGGALQTRRKA